MDLHAHEQKQSKWIINPRQNANVKSSQFFVLCFPLSFSLFLSWAHHNARHFCTLFGSPISFCMQCILVISFLAFGFLKKKKEFETTANKPQREIKLSEEQKLFSCGRVVMCTCAVVIFAICRMKIKSECTERRKEKRREFTLETDRRRWVDYYVYSAFIWSNAESKRFRAIVIEPRKIKSWAIGKWRERE